jgi:hypothetical protein
MINHWTIDEVRRIRRKLARRGVLVGLFGAELTFQDNSLGG